MRFSASVLIAVVTSGLMGCQSGDVAANEKPQMKPSMVKQISFLMPRDVLSGERIDLRVLSSDQCAKILALPLPDPKAISPVASVAQIIEQVSHKKLISLLPSSTGRGLETTRYVAWAEQRTGGKTLGSLLDGYLTWGTEVGARPLNPDEENPIWLIRAAYISQDYIVILEVPGGRDTN